VETHAGNPLAVNNGLKERLTPNLPYDLCAGSRSFIEERIHHCDSRLLHVRCHMRVDA